MKKSAFLFLLIFNISNQTIFGLNYPKYFYPQHILPSDPQIIALGFTGTAFREGLYAPCSNPAGLVFLDRSELGFSRIPAHYSCSSDNKEKGFGQYSFSFGLPVEKYLVLGYYFFIADVGEVLKLDANVKTYSKVRSGIQQYQFSGAMKYKYTDNVSIAFGGNIKYLNIYNIKYLDVYNYADGMCILYDMGVRTNWDFGEKHVLLGLAFINIGDDIQYHFDTAAGTVTVLEEVVKL